MSAVFDAAPARFESILGPVNSAVREAKVNKPVPSDANSATSLDAWLTLVKDVLCLLAAIGPRVVIDVPGLSTILQLLAPSLYQLSMNRKSMLQYMRLAQFPLRRDIALSMQFVSSAMLLQ